MSYNWNTRTELLLGADRMEYLSHCHVLVVGLGGVGAYAAEQICRAGIGHMTIVDADTVNESISTGNCLLCILRWGCRRQKSLASVYSISIPG